MLTFHIITLFPESFKSYLGVSIVARAIKQKKIRIKFYNPRQLVVAKNSSGYTQVDDKAYGGGPGMVLQAEPLLKAVNKIKKSYSTKGNKSNKKLKTIIFSPGGKQFTNVVAEKFIKSCYDLILICGRYEGIDARVKKITKAEEWSVGPYVLTGGELPALIMLDVLSRRLPGVLGKDLSVEERRVASREVYTRPEVLFWQGKNYRVPKVLLSGHHRQIEEWRQKNSQD